MKNSKTSNMNLSLSVSNYFIEWNNFHFGVNTLTGYKAFLTNDQYETIKRISPK